MKFKKIMSLLLVLTLIGTMLTTVTLLNPTAEDTEATTPTTNYNTYVLHAKGQSAPTTARGIYTPIVSGANIKAGETYTITATIQGLTISDYSYIFVRSGDSGNGTLATCQEKGTKATTYSGAITWTAEVTPTTASALFLGIYLNKTYLTNADFYVGGVQVADKKGNNIALDFTADTAIYGMASAQGGVQYSADESAFYESRTMIDIDDVEDETLKKTLFDNFYTGDSMINFKVGTTSAVQSFFRRIPASKLKAGTTYKLSIRYSGSPAIDQYRYFLIREGNKRTISYNLGNITELSGYVNCYEYTAEYTTGDTAQDLYIGVHMNQSGWEIADFTIADMKLVENGKTENLFTPLSDMSNYYRAASTSGSAAIQTLNSAQYISIVKQPLDRDKYFEPENLEAAKYILHVKGKSDAAGGLTVYLRIPSDNIEANKTYTVSVVQQGYTMDASYNNLAVRLGTTGAAANVLANSGAHGKLETTYSGASKWTVDVTPTVKDSLYIGLRLQATPLTTAEYYLGDIKVIDENGNNIAPQLMPSTTIYRSIHHTTSINTTTALSSYFDPIEFIRIDKIEDEALKQKIFNNFYGGDSMLNLSVGSVNE